MAPDTERDFRLGDWLVRPSLNRIERGEESVRLEPKVMDLLAFLAAQHGAVVPKQRLIDAVWATEFIAESALTRAMGELRRALGESAREPRYIETISKRGYRVIAEVEILGQPEAPDTGEMPACLVALEGREVLLAPGVNLIGRAADAAVRVDHLDASRRHARITLTGDSAVVEDLGSKNGTFVWGRPVAGPTPLSDGDRVHIGPVLMVFRVLPAGAATRTSPHGGGVPG